MIKLLTILLILIGIGFSVFLITQRTQIFSRADSVEKPEIQFPNYAIITNVAETSFTISYFTPVKKTATRVQYGKDFNNLDRSAMDDRDTSEDSKWFSHYVTFRNLEPNTTYYIKIQTDQDQKLKNDLIMQKTASAVTTSPDITPEVPRIHGNLEKTLFSEYNEILLYMKTEKGQLVSTIANEKDGSWEFDLTRYRTANFENYYQVLSVDSVDFFGVAGSDGIYSLKIYAYGLKEPLLLKPSLAAIKFYGMRLGPSDEISTSSGVTTENQPEKESGIAWFWNLITAWFGF